MPAGTIHRKRQLTIQEANQLSVAVESLSVLDVVRFPFLCLGTIMPLRTSQVTDRDTMTHGHLLFHFASAWKARRHRVRASLALARIRKETMPCWIVRSHLCGSGMEWKENGSAVVLSLRALTYTPERWDQFWSKVDRWGTQSQ